MATVRLTRDFFLWCMSAVYLFAFASLFVQLPGLYGDKGILPAKAVLGNEATSFNDLVQGGKPTLLRVLPKLGLTIETGMDFLALGGMLLAMVAMVSGAQRNTFTFAFMWIFYFSLYQIGQTFMWFQWDILLLEAGFLCVLVAPLNLFGWSGRVWYHQHDAITLWLVKWLLFRLMFASGVVKLTSQCPTWWGLTALNYHYETQCIATPLAWYAHQLPEWFDKLSVAAVYVIEIALPFLLFSPVRKQRLFGSYAQVKLMVIIQLTGNYNFFNMLTAALCVACLDDIHLHGCMGKTLVDTREDPEKLPVLGKLWRPVKWALNILVFGGLVYWSVKLFGLRLRFHPFSVDSKIMFTWDDLDKFLVTIVPITIWMGALSLAWEIIKAVISSIVTEKGIARKIYNVLGCLIFGAIAVCMFSISLVDHTVVDWNSNQKLSPVIHDWHRSAEKFQLTSSYGLFRRMTGVGGRPEVILEGSDKMDEGWKEYNFLYKPGNVSGVPPIVAPHQPRLDWQMWFAALGNYQQNPWFLNLVYRLFHNEKQVLELMGGDNPFQDEPPKYIRAGLYHYHFTSLNMSAPGSSDSAWWERKLVSEYLPVISVTDPSFVKYIQQTGLNEETTKSRNKKKSSPKANFLQFALLSIRQYIGQPDGLIFGVALFVTACILSFLDPTLRFLKHGT